MAKWHRPGDALADVLREADERQKRVEDETMRDIEDHLDRVNDLLRRLGRDVHRLETAERRAAEAESRVKTNPGYPPPPPTEPAQPCTEDDGRLPGIQYVPKPFRKYVVRAAMFGLVALIVGPDRAKELLGMVISLGAQDSKSAPKHEEKTAEDSGSDLTE